MDFNWVGVIWTIVFDMLHFKEKMSIAFLALIRKEMEQLFRQNQSILNSNVLCIKKKYQK